MVGRCGALGGVWMWSLFVVGPIGEFGTALGERKRSSAPGGPSVNAGVQEWNIYRPEATRKKQSVVVSSSQHVRTMGIDHHLLRVPAQGSKGPQDYHGNCKLFGEGLFVRTVYLAQDGISSRTGICRSNHCANQKPGAPSLSCRGCRHLGSQRWWESCFWQSPYSHSCAGERIGAGGECNLGSTPWGKDSSAELVQRVELARLLIAETSSEGSSLPSLLQRQYSCALPFTQGKVYCFGLAQCPLLKYRCQHLKATNKNNPRSKREGCTI